MYFAINFHVPASMHRNPHRNEDMNDGHTRPRDNSRFCLTFVEFNEQGTFVSPFASNWYLLFFLLSKKNKQMDKANQHKWISTSAPNYLIVFLLWGRRLSRKKTARVNQISNILFKFFFYFVPFPILRGVGNQFNKKKRRVAGQDSIF